MARARTHLAGRSAALERILLEHDRRTGAFKSTGLPQVIDTLQGEAPGRVGVDVFDTVVIRALLRDETVWWLTVHELIRCGEWRESAPDFLTLRQAAAQACPEGTLSQIYSWPALAARCPAGAGVAAEAAMEIQLARPVPGAVESLRRLRISGHQVVFLSDMHLSTATLLEVLRALHVGEPDDELVVSSEAGASKAAGTLFLQLQKEGRGLDWHVGSDVCGDVAMASRAGVPPLPVRVAEGSHLENLFSRGPASTGDVIAGAARQVRAAVALMPKKDAALWETGADVAGQCMTAFLLWLRDQCRAEGITEVCFLARDGALPLAMARAMPPDHWEGLHLRYLHGSRRLWSVASAAVLGIDAWLSAGGDDNAGFVRQNQHLLPWRSLLERVALEPADLVGHPTLQALPPDEPLPVQLDTEWRALLADSDVQAALGRRAEIQLDQLRDMLLAEGSFSGRVALVDVGGRGQLAWQISAVLRTLSDGEPLHLHFGGVDVAADLGDVLIRRFAFDDAASALPFRDVVSCVETFTASGAARAHSVERGTDGVVRMNYHPPVPEMDTRERRLLWAAAEQVAGLLPSKATMDAWALPIDDLDARVRGVLTSFWLSPTRAHALAANQLWSEIDDAGINVRRVAQAYGIRDLRGAGGPPSRTWREGSLRLTPQPVRSALAAGLHLKDGLPPLRRELRNGRATQGRRPPRR